MDQLSPYRHPTPPEATRFAHADNGHLDADAAVAGLVAVIPLGVTLDFISLTGLPRVDLASRFAVTIAGQTAVGLGASLMGWLACALLGVAIALTYVRSLARLFTGTGALTGMLHGLVVWVGAVTSAWLYAGTLDGVDLPVAVSLGAGFAVYGATMGALVRWFVLRTAENHARRMW